MTAAGGRSGGSGLEGKISIGVLRGLQRNGLVACPRCAQGKRPGVLPGEMFFTEKPKSRRAELLVSASSVLLFFASSFARLVLVPFFFFFYRHFCCPAQIVGVFTFSDLLSGQAVVAVPAIARQELFLVIECLALRGYTIYLIGYTVDSSEAGTIEIPAEACKHRFTSTTSVNLRH